MSERAVRAPRPAPARCRCTDAGGASERGFTLIEVLVAATLLIVSVLATLSMLDNATATTAVSKQRDVANALAQDMIERATGGRYTPAVLVPPTPPRNDLTDVDPAAVRPGPADRMRAALDPDDDQASTTVTPATITSGTLPVNLPQSWSLKRKGTVYTVSYSACTLSDTFRGVQIAGPFDCARLPADPGGGDEVTSGTCKLGVVPPGAVNPADPGQLTVKFQLLGIVGVSACVGAISEPLSNALCTLLGTSSILGNLKNSLLGSNGSLTALLGGLSLGGASIGLCESSLTEAGLAGAKAGIGTSTRLAVSVAWTDVGGRSHSIDQSSLIRRGAA